MAFDDYNNYQLQEFPYADTLTRLPDGSMRYSPDGGRTWVVDTPAARNGDQYTRTTYDANGNVLQTQQLTADRMSAGRSALRAALTLGGPAAAMVGGPALAGASGAEAAGLTGAELVDAATTGGVTGSTTAAAAAAPAAASTASGTTAAGTTAAGATAASLLPKLADGSIDWAKVAMNPALWAAAGATAGVVGNKDITSSTNSTGSTSSTGNTNTSSSTGLSPWLQPYAQDAVSRGKTLLDSGTSNQYRDTAGSLLTDYAKNGSPLVNTAMNQQNDVISGKYLGPNEYLDKYAKSIADRMGDAYAVGTRAGTMGQFNRDGNSMTAKTGYGQTQNINDTNFTRGVGDTMSQLYYGNYSNERARQDNASTNSTALARFGTDNAKALADYGTTSQLLPWQQLQAYNSTINPAYGSQTTGSANVSTNANTSNNSNQTINAPSDAMAGAGGAAAAMAMWRQLFGGSKP